MGIQVLPRQLLEPLHGFLKALLDEGSTRGFPDRCISEAFRSVANRLDVGWRKTFRVSCKPVDRTPGRQRNSSEKLRKEPPPKGNRGQTDLDLLGEPSAPQHPTVDLVQMIGRTNEKNVVLRGQAADFNQALFDKLNVMLVEQSSVPTWQQTIDLIEEND